MVNPYHFQPDSRCWDLIDVTLVVEDTDSKFVDAVADVGIYNSQVDERLREPERESVESVNLNFNAEKSVRLLEIESVAEVELAPSWSQFSRGRWIAAEESFQPNITFNSLFPLPLPYHHHYLLFSCQPKTNGNISTTLWVNPLVMFNWLIPGPEADRQIDSGWDYWRIGRVVGN